VQRLFSTFPDGWPGIGLLLLRVGAAVVLIIHGVAGLTYTRAATWGTWAVGALAVVTGALILIGLATPLAGAVAALVSAASAVSWLPSPTPNTLGVGVSGGLLIVMTAAIALLGPGAVSVDAALFGRREITIPDLPDAARED
jgi:uncharacterized membrane protein YphA (DoxX/SURF4 family)